MGNLRGAVLMVIAMGGFAIEDVLLKQLSQTMSVGQMLVLMGLSGVACFALIGRVQGIGLIDRAFLRPAVLARNTGEMLGTLCLVTALSLTPVSVVSSIQQSLPLTITLGAALFLGERVGWRRWCAIGVGMGGVLLILRPFGGDSDPNLLWAVASVAAMTLRDLTSRRGGADVPTLRLSAWGFGAVAVAGFILLATGQPLKWPDGPETVLLAAIMVLGTSSYFAMTQATQIAAISSIAPFRYSRIIFAIMLSMLFLGERPDLATFVGASVVVGAGLYTFARERRLQRQAARARIVASR